MGVLQSSRPTTKSGFRAPPVRHEIEHVDFILDFGGL